MTGYGICFEMEYLLKDWLDEIQSLTGIFIINNELNSLTANFLKYNKNTKNCEN